MPDATLSPISANARSERRSARNTTPPTAVARRAGVGAWVVVVALLLLIGYLQAELWASDGPIRQAQELRDAIEKQRDVNNALQARNDALEAEVIDLKSGLAAIEERARSELGLIRHGEVFYQVVRP